MRPGLTHTTQFLVSSYLTLVICVLGFIGNLLCATVQFNRRTPASSYINLVRALTITDLLLLTLGFFRTLHNMDVINMDCLFEAKIIFFYDWMVASSTKYLTVAISGERCFAINFPFEARGPAHLKRSKWFALGVLLFCVCLTVASFLFNKFVDPGRPYDLWTGVFLQIIPIVLVVIFNVFIFYGIHSHKSMRKTHSDENRSVDRMLMGIVLTFAFCHSFELARRVMNFAWRDYMQRYEYYDYIVNILADIFYVLNSSLDFLIYYLFGQRFRAIFLEVFRDLFGIRGGQKDPNSTGGTDSSAMGSNCSGAKSRNASVECELDKIGK